MTFDDLFEITTGDRQWLLNQYLLLLEGLLTGDTKVTPFNWKQGSVDLAFVHNNTLIHASYDREHGNYGKFNIKGYPFNRIEDVSYQIDGEQLKVPILYITFINGEDLNIECTRNSLPDLQQKYCDSVRALFVNLL